MKKLIRFFAALGFVLLLAGCEQPIDAGLASITVSFDANGGSGLMLPLSAESGVSVSLTANAFTRPGWTFAGWSDSAAGQAVYGDGAAFIVGNADATLYAVWIANPVHTVVFDANGGAGTMAALEVAEGASANLPGNAFTKAGLYFAGWGTGRYSPVSYADGVLFAMGSADVTLYAIWSANPCYAITFDANGGTGLMSRQAVVGGESAYLSPNAFVRGGYAFAGWATSPAGAAAYADGAVYAMGDADATLYAVWTPDPAHTVTFYANGGTGTMDVQSIDAGTTANLRANTFVKSGYTFAGWALEPAGSVVFVEGAQYAMGGADVSLYAIWNIGSYKATFYANGGTGTMDAQIIAVGATVNLNANTFVKTGCYFSGWALEPAGSVVYTDGSQYPMGDADVSLYAKWAPKTYTVTFDANGGAGSMAPLSLVFGASMALPENIFSKTELYFGGWSMTSAGPVLYANGATFAMGPEDVILYAIWNGGTPGLEFTPINGDTEYEVSHGTITSGELVIPQYHNSKKVTAIAAHGFENCSGLTGNLTLPSTISSIGEYAFSGCSGFSGCLSIPDCVTSIGAYAFTYCTGFTGELIIPAGVTSISDGVFWGCAGFSGNLSLPTGVTAIGAYAFADCPGFSGDLVIPNGVISIGSTAFAGCIEFDGSLFIPETVTSLGSYSFAECWDLTIMVIDASLPPGIIFDTFVNTSFLEIKVPAGSVDAYKADANWSYYASIIVSQ